MPRSNSSNFRRAFATAFACCLAATSCASGDDADDADHHSTEGDGAAETPSGAECPAQDAPTYENFGRDFMTRYCVRCHSSELQGTARNGAPDGHDFDVYQGIVPVAEHIDQFAAAGPTNVNVRMPPNGATPTMSEREKLGEWMACELEALENRQ